MNYKLQKAADTFKVDKHGLSLSVFESANDFGVVTFTTKEGHNQEFFHKTSTFHYVITEGEADFFLDDEQVSVAAGDMLSIESNTRIYYKGKIKAVLITTPPWTEEDEVETKAKVW